jgi:TrmH family RNA methyltransferase
MVSKNSLKYIKSLQIKKYRQQEHCFTVEGKKSVLEAMRSSFNIKMVAASPSFFEEESVSFSDNVILIEIGTRDLSRISSFKTNDSVIAVVEMPPNEPLLPENEWIIVLDGIKDPGNLGTILRIADWYGIQKVICSEDTVDVYNPKCIASSMGSFTRVKTYYTSLEAYLPALSVPVYGALLTGENVHNMQFEKEGVLLLGSESHGIRDRLLQFLSKKISIPSFGGAESLNAAVATGVIIDNIRRGKN